MSKYILYLIYGFTAMSKPVVPNKIFFTVICMQFFLRYLECCLTFKLSKIFLLKIFSSSYTFKVQFCLLHFKSVTSFLTVSVLKHIYDMLNKIKDSIHAKNMKSYPTRAGCFFSIIVKVVFFTSIIYQFHSMNISQESNQTKKKKVNLPSASHIWVCSWHLCRNV